jgi:mono/diheme cytochrome c family protein
MYTPVQIRRGLALAALALAAPSAADEPPPMSPSGSFADPGRFVAQDGETLFRSICQGCHMPDARGAQGAAAYPALAGNARLASAAYTVNAVALGRANMPPFFFFMSDQQIAAVVNFVRMHFDNHYDDAVTAEDVHRLRPQGKP